MMLWWQLAKDRCQPQCRTYQRAVVTVGSLHAGTTNNVDGLFAWLIRTLTPGDEHILTEALTGSRGLAQSFIWNWT